MSKLPLEGIRVVEITVVWSGPSATMMLADLGAEVIRVENISHFPTATRGTMSRPTKTAMSGSLGSAYPDREAGEKPWNRFAWFNANARNKVAMTVDLKKQTGRDIIYDLIKISDIFVENNAAATMDKIGLDYETLSGIKQDLIMVSMPAFGTTGPYRDYKGFAPIIDALAGHTWIRGYKNSDPSRTGVPVYHSDAAGGAHAAFAVLTALYHRQMTGEGQFVDLSQAESIIPHLGEAVMDYTLNKRDITPIGNQNQYRVPQGCYRCKGDDNWITISIGTEEEWTGFCEIMKNQDLADNEKFSDIINRRKNCDELDKLIEEWTIKQDHYEIMHIMQKKNIPCGPVLNEEEILSDPHLKERNFFIDISHPEAGTHPHAGFLWKMSKTPSKLRFPAPLLGEHNDYVYRELLGKNKEEIEELKSQGHIVDVYPEDVH